MDQFLLNDFALATYNEIYDTECNNGEWNYQHDESNDSFDDFIESSKKYWKESTKEKFGEIAGMKFLAFGRIQIKKGAPRYSFSVVDFGDCRVAIYGVDLTNFVITPHTLTKLANY